MPPVATLEEVRAHLVQHHIAESFTTAIASHATRHPHGYYVPSIEVGGSRHRASETGYEFRALVDPAYFEPIIPYKDGGDAVSAIRIYGKRHTAGGMFDYQYSFHLPLIDNDDGTHSLETRVDPDVWFKAGGVESRTEPALVLQLMREAAQDLYDAIAAPEDNTPIARSVGTTALDN